MNRYLQTCLAGTAAVLLAGAWTIASAKDAQEESLRNLRQQLNSQERVKNAQHPRMTRLEAGNSLSKDNYEIVDLTGSVTRSVCPYTCSDRGLKESNCHAWRSGRDKDECYVRDTSIPSDAFVSIDSDKTKVTNRSSSRAAMRTRMDEKSTANAQPNSRAQKQSRMERNKNMQEKTQISDEQADAMIYYYRRVQLADGNMTELLRSSADTLMTMQREGRITDQQLAKARCVVVMPGVTKVALVAGARHGDGIAACKENRGDQERWSSLGFVDLAGASIGAQIGGTKTDLVMLLNNDKAFQALKRGKLTFGTDATAAFQGSHAQASALNSDVIVVGKTEGTFAGASLNGAYIAADEEELQEFYDENAKFERIVSTYELPGHPLIIFDTYRFMSEETT